MGDGAKHWKRNRHRSQGLLLGTFLGCYEKTPPVFNAYRKAYRETGHGDEVPLENLGYSGLIFVGETEEEGRAGGQQLLWYLSHNKLPMHFKNPPSYANIDANAIALKVVQISVRR